MIMRYGMSEKLGPRVLGRNHDMPFLGREMGNEPDYSDEIAREIDDEIRRVIEEAHETAHRVLREHMDELHRLSMILIERETIDKDQFERLLAGEAEDRGLPRRAEEAPEPAPEPSRSGSPLPKPAAVPASGRDDAAAPARRREGLTHRQARASRGRTHGRQTGRRTRAGSPLADRRGGRRSRSASRGPSVMGSST